MPPPEVNRELNRRERERAVPLPTLSETELQALCDWRVRWGATVATREPAEGNTLRRIWPDRLPLIEFASRAGYDRLTFARALVSAGVLNEGES